VDRVEVLNNLPLGSLPSVSSGELNELVSFKAIVDGETLRLRGYIRWSFATATSLINRIAQTFGEFQFLGCRKIVTATPNSQLIRYYALAPTGTQFDRMWFSGVSSGLTLFDGHFPAVVTDPDTLSNKADIAVLGQTPPPAFQLLAPHQDLQFTGDRPFSLRIIRGHSFAASTELSLTLPVAHGLVGILRPLNERITFLRKIPNRQAFLPANWLLH